MGESYRANVEYDEGNSKGMALRTGQGYPNGRPISPGEKTSSAAATCARSAGQRGA